MRIIRASEIDMSDALGLDDKNFWNHHGYDHDSYIRLASRIPDVMNMLDKGYSINDLQEDPELFSTAQQYFNPAKMIRVDAVSDNTYSYSGDGRHRIMAAIELGLDIPVIVNGQSEDETYDAASYSQNDNNYENDHTPGGSYMSKYYAVRNTPYPYADDEALIHDEKKTLLGRNEKVIHPLKDSYQQAVGALNASTDFQNFDWDSYRGKLYSIQDELGYYPEFDPRMGEDFQQLTAAKQEEFSNAYADRYYKNGDDNSRKAFLEGYQAMGTQAQFELGYFPYDPNYGNSLQADIEEAKNIEPTDNSKLNESQDEQMDMSQYADSSEENYHSFESEDASQTNVDSLEGSAEDMNSYVGISSDSSEDHSSEEEHSTEYSY